MSLKNFAFYHGSRSPAGDHLEASHALHRRRLNPAPPSRVVRPPAHRPCAPAYGGYKRSASRSPSPTSFTLPALES